MNSKTHYIFRDKITDFYVNGNRISIYIVNSDEPACVVHTKDSEELQMIIADLTHGDSKVMIYDFPQELSEEHDACKKEEIKEEKFACIDCGRIVNNHSNSICDDCLPF